MSALATNDLGPTRPASTGVSGRFLADLLQVLERRGIPAIQLIGDLPIRLTDGGLTDSHVEWSDFVEFMKRLEHQLGGPEALEACGAGIGEMKPATILRVLAGLYGSSPAWLYRTAIRWALYRALPAIEARLVILDGSHIEIHARLREGARPCPQIFHFASGAVRAMPRMIGLPDAVVEATIEPGGAVYRVTLPPSLGLLARAWRFLRALLSAGSVLHVLEEQQLELHAQHVALLKAHADLLESESRFRALADAAADALCEVDAEGRVVYASASIREVMGYSPEQVIGSHFRLWVDRQEHQRVDAGFAAMAAQPPGGGVLREQVTLHGSEGRKVFAEFSARSYLNADGQWRLAAILREDRLHGAASAIDPDPVPPNDSMTRVVDAALVAADGRHAAPEWIETRKLMERVRLEWEGRDGEQDIALRLRFEHEPGELWGRADLLLIGLTSLLDHAQPSADPSSSIELRTTLGQDSAGNPTVDFEVEVLPGAGRDATWPALAAPKPMAPRTESDRDDDARALAAAIAADAAKLHGGEVGSDSRPDGTSTRWLRIPQIARDPSTLR